MEPLKELSLFTGAGGGLLGSILLGWKTIGAVEIEEYPCKVLRQRQKDGCLEDFPIWQMDIRDFNRYVAPVYKGMVDVITAGFPCQPFSVAGKQEGEDDPRNQWPATRDTISTISPRYIFLENVTGLLVSKYIWTILAEITALGYDSKWGIISAKDVGAPHHRKRWWLVGKLGNP